MQPSESELVGTGDVAAADLMREQMGSAAADLMAGRQMGSADALPWVRVSSTNLHSLCYEPLTGTLFVRFWRGKVESPDPDTGCYRYDAVPPALYRELLAAPSIGRFFAAHIKNDFTVTRLELLP